MSFYTDKAHPLTSVYHRPALKPTLKTGLGQLLVFIPGNPGLIDYYTTYLNLVQKRNPGLDVLNISHAGYQTTDDFVAKGEGLPYEFYDIHYQVDHKVSVIKQYLATLVDRKHTEIFILCHSMGAYVTQRLVHRLLDKKSGLESKISIRFVGLICPTILDIRLSLSGVALTRLLRFLPLVNVALFLTWILRLFLSESTIKSIIRYKFSTHPDVATDADVQHDLETSVEATYKLVLLQRIVRQALDLAENEMAEITQHDQENDFFFKALPISGVKVWVFFAELDYWVHDNTRDSIMADYYDPNNLNLDFELGPDSITHSFCVDRSKEFAEITCNALDRAFPFGI